jgi:L-lactate dehydrogenase (cytochrome)
MYSNVYGLAGVTKLIQLMKTEILSDAAQIGITDISKIDPKRVSVLDI